MSFLQKLFGKSKPEPIENFIQVDMHSHLLPGIDDGVDDFEESIAVIREFSALGYKKLITTPHIMADFYRNSAEIIKPLRDQLQELVNKEGINMRIEAAAEYYIDEFFTDRIGNEEILSFGENYVLIEMSYLNPAPNFDEAVFKLKVNGYQPILAHPERYVFLYDNWSKYEELFQKDVLFQLNLASLAGYYSKQAQKMAERMIKERMIRLVGSDLHHLRHIQPLKNAIATPSFAMLKELPLLNNSLL